MAWIIPQSRTTEVALNDGWDVLVGHLVAITVESGGSGIIGHGSGHHARIYGLVASAFGVPVMLGTTPHDHSGHVVEVYQGAQIHHLGFYYAIGLAGFASTVINEGLITSTAIGILLGGIDSFETASTVTNRGTIEAVGSAVHRHGDEPIRIVNTGTIKSGTNAFVSEGAGIDHITNSGTMIGNVRMGLDNDLYDGRFGRIDGQVFAGAGEDRLYSGTTNDRLHGDEGNDTLDGGGGSDQMTGGLGNDVFYVDNSGDKVFEAAGQGSDTLLSSVSYALAAGQHVETLRTTALTGTATISLAGNELAQAIIGNNGINALYGNGGNDALYGNAGNDLLFGGLGNDTLAGGAGSDSFVFNTALNSSSNVDRIMDFNVAQDTIRLDNAVMPGLGAALGTLAEAKFWKSAAGVAHDADDRIIYDIDSGRLFYDANGNGAGGVVQIAQLIPNLALTREDFMVI